MNSFSERQFLWLVVFNQRCICADEFRDFFTRYGEVKDHQIMRDHSTNRSRGFGFITFDSEEAVDDLLSMGNKIEFAGAQVRNLLLKPSTCVCFTLDLCNWHTDPEGWLYKILNLLAESLFWMELKIVKYWQLDFVCTLPLQKISLKGFNLQGGDSLMALIILFKEYNSWVICNFNS